MRPRWGLLWLLGAAASCLPPGSRGLSLGSSHCIIRVSYSSATEACPGLPHFSAQGYVNDQLITRYESLSRKLNPGVDWINSLEQDYPEFYRRYTLILQKDQNDFKENVHMLQKRYNQSRGYHIVQMMISCEVWGDGKRKGHWQYGYDGRDFVSYDMETSTWTATDKEAQAIQRWWNDKTAIKERFTGYLNSTCAEWLEKYNQYRPENFSKPPMMTLKGRTEADGIETHVCRAYGFYPKDIEVFWTRDGEVWEMDTFRGIAAPNLDGTYYYYINIWIDPKERGRYRCHVEHDGLQEPLSLALKEPESGSSLGLIIGSVVAGLILVCAIVGILVFLRFKKRNDSKNDSSYVCKERFLDGSQVTELISTEPTQSRI